MNFSAAQPLHAGLSLRSQSEYFPALFLILILTDRFFFDPAKTLILKLSGNLRKVGNFDRPREPVFEFIRFDGKITGKRAPAGLAHKVQQTEINYDVL